jgi:hypothetical protein
MEEFTKPGIGSTLGKRSQIDIFSHDKESECIAEWCAKKGLRMYMA